MSKVLIVVPHLYGSMRLLADNMRYLDLKRYRITLLVLDPVLTLQDEFPPEVAIVTLGGAAARSSDGYPLERGKLRTWSRRLIQLWREARKHDLVVSWSELTPTYVTAVAALLARKPVIGWVHVHLSRTFELGIRPRWAHRPAIRLFYPALHRVVGCSRPVTADLQTAFTLKNVTCISNTIDLDRVRRLAAEEIDPDLSWIFRRPEPVVINVAALEPQKGQEVLLGAHARLIEKGVRHNLVVVGDGTQRAALEILAAELGVSSTVHFAGFRKNPYSLIARASALVLSSHMEGYALVLAESIALGVPPVSTDCDAGPREVLQDGRLGLLVPVNDEEGLARAMHRILTESSLRDRFADEARGDCEHVDAARSAAQIETLFEQALARSARAC
jgi:glycosyltransferase involved in cell wall biosynthesis